MIDEILQPGSRSSIGRGKLNLIRRCCLRSHGDGLGDTALTLLILAGGLGSRLRSVTRDKVAKPMVDVLGRPFLYWVIEDLVLQGFRQIWLSLGHKGETITAYPWRDQFPACEISFIVETESQGTGGAIVQFFEDQSQCSECVVVNGDTHTVTTNFMIPDEFESAQSEVHFLTLEESRLTGDQEANLCVEEGRIVACSGSSQPSQFDTGVVKIMRQAVDRYNGPMPCSIHDLILPSVLSGSVMYSEIDARCFDIGTPERLYKYQSFRREGSL